MKLLLTSFLALHSAEICNAFTSFSSPSTHEIFRSTIMAPRAFVVNSNLRTTSSFSFQLYSGTEDGSEGEASEDEDKAAKEEAVGNLVADDEWMGLTMEITELVRTAIIEDVKSKTSEFIGKDEYKVGDISKELDDRVKKEIANLREKDEYELGDLTTALDAMSKDFTCELTGKDEYEFGDLSTEIDKRVKNTVADYCGKDEYEFGDLSKEIDSRAKAAVAEFTGKDEYEFGDITRTIEERRQKWVEETLGADAASRYQFGDITKKALANFTGKEEYEFGDVTKKIMGDLFGKRKRGNK